MKTLLVALLLASPLLARADNFLTREGSSWRWTWYDTALEAAFMAATVADCAMTLQATSRYKPDAHGNYMEESNPYLGRRPSPTRIRTACAGVLLTHVGLTVLAPRPVREIFQGATLFVEIDAVRSQRRLGLAVRF